MSIMKISVEAPTSEARRGSTASIQFAVFNTERFKRYGLLLAYQVHDAAEAVIQRLEEDCDGKAKRSKQSGKA